MSIIHYVTYLFKGVHNDKADDIWSMGTLRAVLGNVSVIINASPTSEFDGVSFDKSQLRT